MPKRFAPSPGPVLPSFAAQTADEEFAGLPILDPKILKTLEEELSPNAVRNFLRLFLSDAAARLEEIKTVAAFERMDEVASLAHDLVSTAGNIGALQMSSGARALARACRNEDKPRARLYLDSLALATYAACLEVQRWLNAAAESSDYQGLERRRVAQQVAKDRRRKNS